MEKGRKPAWTTPDLKGSTRPPSAPGDPHNRMAKVCLNTKVAATLQTPRRDERLSQQFSLQLKKRKEKIIARGYLYVHSLETRLI